MSTIEQVRTAPEVVPVELPHRIVRVNLLPDEVGAARKLRGIQIGLAIGILAVAAAIGGLYFYERGQVTSATEELNAAQAVGAKLTAEKATFTEVPRILAAIEAAEMARQTAMASDVEWTRILLDFSYVPLENIWFTNLTMNVAPVAAAADAAAGTDGAAAAAPLGQIVVDGTAMKYEDLAAWLESMRDIDNLDNDFFTNATKEKMGSTPVVKFNSTATLNQTALSHRYDRKQGKP